MADFMAHEAGYLTIQSTRPQTMAFSLADSPIGQLAWIIEKFKTWSSHDTALPEDVASRDALLTNLTLYWLTGTIGSSIDGYYDGMRANDLEPGLTFTMPVGMVAFPHDSPPPRRYAKRLLGRLDFWAAPDHGGQFTAWENPTAFAAVESFARQLVAPST